MGFGEISIAELLVGLTTLQPRDAEAMRRLCAMLHFEQGAGLPDATPTESLAVPAAPLSLEVDAAPLTLETDAALFAAMATQVSPSKSSPSTATTPQRMAHEFRPWQGVEALPEHAPLQQRPPLEPLLPPLRRTALLSTALSTFPLEGDIDLGLLIQELAANRPLKRLPRRPSPTLRLGVQLLADFGEGMAPYARDRSEVIESIRRCVGEGATDVKMFSGTPLRGAGGGPRSAWSRWSPPPRGVPVVVLSDLGLGGPMFSPDRAPSGEWLAFCERLERAGCPLVTFLPHEPSSVPRALVHKMQLVQWDQGTTVRAVRHGTWGDTPPGSRGHDEVLRLAEVLSLATRVSPELLRKARLRLTPELGAGAEASLWFGPLVESFSSSGFVLRQDVTVLLRERLRVTSSRLDSAWKLLQEFHPFTAPAVALEENVTWVALKGGVGAEVEIERLLGKALSAMLSSQERGRGIARWAARALPRLPETALASEAASLLALGTAARLGKQAVGTLRLKLPTDFQEPARQMALTLMGSSLLDESARQSSSPLSSKQFATEITEHAQFLRPLARRFAGNDPIADDLVQETLLRYVRQVSEGGLSDHNPDVIRRWLVTVLRRFAADYLRRQRIPSGAELWAPTWTQSEPSDEDAWKRVTERELDDALEHLPTHERAAFKLFSMGYTYAEIAETLNIPRKKVGSRLARARQELKHLLMEATERKNQ